MSVASLPLRVTKAGELIQLEAPGVGIFAPNVAEDELVSSGQLVGTIETLGVARELRVPAGIAGRVHSRAGGHRNRVPVEYGQVLISLSVADVVDSSAGEKGAATDVESLSFNAPMSGRFYGRPSPEEAPFVAPGDTVKLGQTVGLLEVMKTFNRLVYEGDALPDTARIVAVVPADGDDVTRGNPILRLDSDVEG